MDGQEHNGWLHGGDLVAMQLKSEGVSRIFTLTGAHISAIYDGARFQNIQLIDFRHEQAAVFAADAYARLTRGVSAVALTAGPGVLNGLTGVANAFYANSPVMVMGGRNPFALGESGNLQDAPQLELTKPITKYSAAVYDSYRIPHVMREAAAHTLCPRFGPSYVDLPMDVQLTRMSPDMAPPIRSRTRESAIYPDFDVVRQAADLIYNAAKPVVIAGSGAYWGGAEQHLDELLLYSGLPIYLNGMARGLLGPNHPNELRKNRRGVLSESDVILLLGVDLDFRFGYGQPNIINSNAKIIQVDPDGTTIGKHRDVNIGVVSDISTFLRSLVNVLTPNKNSAVKLLGEYRLQEDRSQKRQNRRGGNHAIHPEDFVLELASVLDPETIVIGDGGDIVALFARHYRVGAPGHWMDPGPFGCLGIGVPFAMGARLAKPGNPIVVVSGDGSFGFNAFEIEAAVRQSLPFVLVIGNDGAWGEMRTFQEEVFGPEDLNAQYLSQTVKYEEMVNALGGFGQRVERIQDLKPAVTRALKSNVPAVVNVILDPAYRRQADTISGRHMATAYGGDADAYMRRSVHKTYKA